MEWINLVKPNFKPKMDYEQFFTTQEMQPCECDREKLTIGLLATMICVYILIDCISMCSTSRKMKTLRDENETLKSIVFKSMERGLIRMMHMPQEDEHED